MRAIIITGEEKNAPAFFIAVFEYGAATPEPRRRVSLCFTASMTVQTMPNTTKR